MYQSMGADTVAVQAFCSLRKKLRRAPVGNSTKQLYCQYQQLGPQCRLGSKAFGPNQSDPSALQPAFQAKYEVEIGYQPLHSAPNNQTPL